MRAPVVTRVIKTGGQKKNKVAESMSGANEYLIAVHKAGYIKIVQRCASLLHENFNVAYTPNCFAPLYRVI